MEDAWYLVHDLTMNLNWLLATPGPNEKERGRIETLIAEATSWCEKHRPE